MSWFARADHTGLSAFAASTRLSTDVDNIAGRQASQHTTSPDATKTAAPWFGGEWLDTTHDDR